MKYTRGEYHFDGLLSVKGDSVKRTGTNVKHEHVYAPVIRKC